MEPEKKQHRFREAALRKGGTAGMEDRFDDLEPKEPRSRRILRIAALTVLLAAATAGILWIHRSVPAASAPAATALPGGILRAEVLDLEKGECVLLVSPHGKTMLADAGDKGDYSRIREYLQEKGLTGIDVLAVCSPEEDNLERLLDDFRIGEVWISPQYRKADRFSAFLSLAESAGAAVRSEYGSVSASQDWDPDVEVRILSPYQTEYPDREDAGLVLRVRCGATSVLIPGRISELSERLIVKALPDSLLHAQILLVSGSGASRKFLGAVRPLYAVSGFGENRPDAEEARRIREAGAELIRTDETGTVRFFLDGAEVQVIE